MDNQGYKIVSAIESTHGFPADNSSNLDSDSYRDSVTTIETLDQSDYSKEEHIVNVDTCSDDGVKKEIEVDENSSTYERLVAISSIAFPIIVSFFLNIGGGFINLIYAGSYVLDGSDTTVFDGISLSNMYCNVTFLSLLIGLSSAIETLGSQHNGAKNYKEVGIVLQRSFVVLGVLTLPVFFLWYFSGTIFRYFGVNAEICQVISDYVRIRMLTIPLDVLDISYEKYLMAIGIVHPSMWANISFNLTIILFDSLFVYVLKYPYTFLGYTWVIARYVSAILQFRMSLSYKEVQRTLQPFDRAALRGLFQFFSIGLPGTVMLISEWWSYEILTLFASSLGPDPLAAEAIILQTAGLCYMLPLGLGIASSSLVGNALGAMKKDFAVQLSRLIILVSFVLQSFVGILLMLFGTYFVRVFTKNENVLAISSSTLPFLSIFTLFDALQGVASGILRGAGKQTLGAICNVIAFYALGLPAAYVACFVYHADVPGLIMGISAGTFFQVGVLLFMIFFCPNYLFTTIIHPNIEMTDLALISENPMITKSVIQNANIEYDRNSKKTPTFTLEDDEDETTAV